MNGNYGSQEQRRQSGLKSGGSWNWVKNVDFSRHISEKFRFFQSILPQKWVFQAKIGHIQLFLGKLFKFYSKVTTFEHTFRYMIRCNNTSRPVNDPNYPLRPHDPKSEGVVTLSTPQD